MTTLPPEQEDSRYAAVRQYSLAQILAVWAAAAIPMAVLAWLVAPLLGALLGGGDVAFIKALLLCLTAGLIWQFVLTLILTRREQGTLRWSRVRDALWLLSPRNPRSGRVGGRVWLWVIPFIVLFGIWEFFGFDITGPANRDLDSFWCEIEERTTVGIGWPFWLRVWSASSITEPPMFELWYPGWPSGPPSPPIYRSPPRLYPDNGPGIRGAS